MSRDRNPTECWLLFVMALGVVDWLSFGLLGYILSAIDSKYNPKPEG